MIRTDPELYQPYSRDISVEMAKCRSDVTDSYTVYKTYHQRVYLDE